MPTEDYHQKNTKPSKVVRVTVIDDDGSFRVFHLTNAKVVLRAKIAEEYTTYHPDNIAHSSKFACYPTEDIELAIVTSELVELEVLDEDRS
jgi:hypothetical protein